MEVRDPEEKRDKRRDKECEIHKDVKEGEPYPEELNLTGCF